MKSLFPSLRHPVRWLRFRLRENWAQEWKLGPFRFSVEWVPKASHWGFYFDLDLSGGRYDD